MLFSFSSGGPGGVPEAGPFPRSHHWRARLCPQWDTPQGWAQSHPLTGWLRADRPEGDQGLSGGLSHRQGCAVLSQGGALRGCSSQERGAGVGETMSIAPRTREGARALSRLTLRCHRRRVSLRGLSLYPGLFHDQEAEGPHRRLLPLPGAQSGDSPASQNSQLRVPSLRKLPAGALLLLLSSPAHSVCPKGTRPVSPWAMASVVCVPHLSTWWEVTCAHPLC